MIKAVVFDFDDTLINNQKLDHQGFVIPCIKLGIKPPSFKYVINQRRKGLLANDIVRQMQNISKSDFSIQTFLSIRKKFFHGIDSIPSIQLKKKTKSLLRFLHNNNYKVFLCSVRQNKLVPLQFLKREKIDQHFTNLYCMEDLKFTIDNSKSSNRILIKSSLLHMILKKTMLKPDEIIFIGNSYEDMVSSKSLHIPFIYYRNSYAQENISAKNAVSKMDDIKRKLLQIKTTLP